MAARASIPSSTLGGGGSDIPELELERERGLVRPEQRGSSSSSAGDSERSDDVREPPCDDVSG